MARKSKKTYLGREAAVAWLSANPGKALFGRSSRGTVKTLQYCVEDGQVKVYCGGKRGWGKASRFEECDRFFEEKPHNGHHYTPAESNGNGNGYGHIVCQMDGALRDLRKVVGPVIVNPMRDLWAKVRPFLNS